MKRFLILNTLFFTFLFLTSCGGGGSNGGDDGTILPPPPPVPTPSPSLQHVMILYDTAGVYTETGKTNALLLQNLLGHFSITITSKPADQYIANEIVDQNITTVFYLGTTYDVLSYYANNSNEYNSYIDFYHDIATHSKTVVWINYNLDSLEYKWDVNGWGSGTFEGTTGFTYFYEATGLKYNRIQYKNTELYKGVIPFATPGSDTTNCEDEGNNVYACDTALNLIGITDEALATNVATAYSTLDITTPEEPYITHGGYFWFVGDIPFSYMSEEDRYLAFADLLHDMLGIDHNESHKAIMRLEDVDAETTLSDLTTIADFMRSQNIPFNVATIPQYEDPYGIENNGLSTTVKLSESPIGVQLKEYYYERLIDIVQHGFTHQLYDLANPYNGLTGDDFEFMIVTDEYNDGNYVYVGPSENDDGTWAGDRITDGKTILEDTGLEAFAWEAPHYMAGPNHYRSIKDIYPIQYSRLIYYPLENSDDLTKKYQFIGQSFPYVIRKDTYGYYIIPENISNIVNNPNDGFREITAYDIIRFAQKLKVVRDGVASFYYHPYLGTNDLSIIVNGLENEGYEFVRATSLVE